MTEICKASSHPQCSHVCVSGWAAASLDLPGRYDTQNHLLVALLVKKATFQEDANKTHAPICTSHITLSYWFNPLSFYFATYWNGLAQLNNLFIPVCILQICRVSSNFSVNNNPRLSCCKCGCRVRVTLNKCILRQSKEKAGNFENGEKLKERLSRDKYFFPVSSLIPFILSHRVSNHPKWCLLLLSPH